MKLYGIPNCDTVKKARNWLDKHNLDYDFHDFRKDGVDEALISQWIAELGWEQIVNKRSTSWRNLPDDTKASMNAVLAIQEVMTQPTLIKRPVLQTKQNLVIGFNDKTYQELL